MMNLIVSTCGTSIFTADASPETRKLLTDHANAKSPSDIAPQALQAIQSHVKRCLAELATLTSISTLCQHSAEINGLASFYGGQLSGKDHHIFMATDTWLGEQAALAIAGVLQRHGQSTEVKRVQDLRTDDLPAYRCALSELVQWAYTTLPEYRRNGYGVVFNLTGGFKAVQGFMQTLGMLHADECVYVYERSAQLIRLPRLPIKMQADSFVRDHLLQFRRMAMHLPVPSSAVRLVPEALLFVSESEAGLSEWGEMVWLEIKDEIYAGKLHPSPSAKVQWADGFERSVQGLERKRTQAINAKVDDLARFLETGQSIKSLDFKSLKGGAIQGSTHEIDAWSDGDAKRLYGHFEKDVFVLDRLAQALH
ncbi:MAG: putative CRISPR-associated protein [Comamonadaceae bacterium]|nr:putative CRISPR-associated protein [Comamonadaceae bacterium]